MELKIYFYFILVVAITWGKSSFVSQWTSAEAAMISSIGDLVSNQTAGGADPTDDLGASYDEFVMESEISHAVLLANGIFTQATGKTQTAKKAGVVCDQIGYRPCLPKANGGRRHCPTPYDRKC